MNFDFDYQGKRASISLPITAQLRTQFANSPKSFSYTGALPSNWKQDYFKMFLKHDADKMPLATLREEIAAHCGASSGDVWVAAVIDFVQSGLEYDHATAFNIAGSKIRYPSETLLDGMGVCMDKTILLAALLQDAGHGLGIFNFDRANHMSLGLLVPDGYGNFGTSYAMVESTAPTPIGQIPARYAGGIRLDTRPELVIIGNGHLRFNAIVAQKDAEKEAEKQYGKDYLAMPAAKQAIYRDMQELKLEMDQAKVALKGCKGRLDPQTYARCQGLNASFNQLVERYNALVAQFNQK